MLNSFRLEPGEEKVWDHAVEKPITVRGHIRTERTGTPVNEGQVGVLKDGKRLVFATLLSFCVWITGGLVIYCVFLSSDVRLSVGVAYFVLAWLCIGVMVPSAPGYLGTVQFVCVACLTLYGATFQEDVVFQNLVSYIEAGRIRPVIARTYPLSEIVQAQKDFLEKGHVGKLVLIPPGDLP